MWNINSLASSDLAHSGMLLRTSRTASGSDLRSKLCYLQSSHAKCIRAEDTKYIWMNQFFLQPAELFINFLTNLNVSCLSDPSTLSWPQLSFFKSFNFR